KLTLRTGKPGSSEAAAACEGEYCRAGKALIPARASSSGGSSWSGSRSGPYLARITRDGRPSSMADIFLSYASEDRERARLLASALQSLGWSLWWDRKIPAGKTFAEVIEAAITESRCVIVLWSRESVKSQWVREEADEGKRRGKLVPVVIDNVEPPMGFRAIHAADLVGWDGASTTAGFEQLAGVLTVLRGGRPDGRATTGSRAPLKAISADERRPPARRRRWLPAVIAIALVALAGWGLGAYQSDVQRRAAGLETQRRALVDERR